MAVITGSVSRNPGRYTYQLVCEEINLDTANNTSQLQVTVQIVTGGTSGTTMNYCAILQRDVRW